MPDIQQHALISIGSDKISDDAPCGENARYEAEFEQLEAELAKQESLSSATVDWSTVVDLSSVILKDKSKDILIGSYLCYGLLLKESYPGLAVGLKILSDMVEAHWDCLFPPAKRMRARQTAFQWLSEKAGMMVAEKTPAADETEAVIAAADFLKQLDNALFDKMGDQAPMMTDLSRPLKNYRQSAEAELAKQAAAAAQSEPAPSAAEPAAPAAEAAPTAAAEPVAAAPPPPAPAASAPTAPKAAAPSAAAIASGSIGSDTDSKKVLRQVQSVCRDISTYWSSQNLADPRLFRLNRTAAWMVIEGAPPANDGVTMINPPAEDRLKFFQTKMDKGEYALLVGELEKTLARSPFWLDGHFMVVQALKALGANYDAAVKTVARELGSLLDRVPELLDLSFSDNTPFASDQTRMWIDAEVMKSGGSGAEGGSSDTADPWVVGLQAAGRKAAAGDNAEAMDIMRKGLAQAGQQRDQTYWRCALAQLLINVGDAEPASNILEQVAGQLADSPLQDWEPGLLSHVYKLLLQSYQKQQKKNKEDPSLKDKVEKTYEKLCWYDPVTALSVKGG